ncbi:hypothetical protein V6N12_009438 [Hibiscus sabdariffa]|uniref:Secreted protein n=1 Tax=Hibiscus sabdariffa TaxID=183260 RepID=A0ABR2E958_9ROSI
MHSPLSWRWPWWWWGCYAWCTSRIPFGATLWFSVSWGGASLVRLASSTRDRFGSPQLEPGSLLPRLGFHPKSEGYSVGALGKPRPSLEVILHAARPLVGFAVQYTGLAPRSCCLARPVHWHPCLHRLGVHWNLLWPHFALVCPSASIECFNPSSLLCTRPALLASPWLCPPGCEPYSTHGTFVLRPRCPFRRLAAHPVRTFPWPVRPLVAWRASHHWADLFGPLSCAKSLRLSAFVSSLS